MKPSNHLQIQTNETNNNLQERYCETNPDTSLTADEVFATRAGENNEENASQATLFIP